MSSYDVITEYGQAEDGDISLDPYWILGVVRFKYPVTYSRRNRSSFSKDYAEGAMTRGKPLVITSDCLEFSTVSNKGQPNTTLSATLLPGSMEWLSEIYPDDWVFGWMFNSREHYVKIMSNLESNSISKCNYWQSGLKFMGRADSVVRNLSQSPDGRRQVRYQLTAHGFNEISTKIFFNLYLSRNFKTIGSQWQQMGLPLEGLLGKGGGIEADAAIAAFTDLFLGKGIPSTVGINPAAPGGEKAGGELVSTAGSAENYGYMVPEQVGAIMGTEWKQGDRPTLSYADFLQTITGIQEYDPSAKGFDYWNPKLQGEGGSRRRTPKPLEGLFLPVPPQFSDKSLWSILQAYLNPGLNEMYVTLRTATDGRIMPTLVARQFPFSTDWAIEPPPDKGDLPWDGESFYTENHVAPDKPAPTPREPSVTKFHSLPRWVLHPSLIKSWTTGRSRALKTNWLMMLGDPGQMKMKDTDPALQMVNNPPIRDDLDIARSGLKQFSTSIAIHPKLIKNRSMSKWTPIIADFVNGQHMTLTGTLSCVGIQAPICIGDNLEVDGVLYHIEGVRHQAGFTGDGKTFTTSLSLTHGVAADNQGQADLGFYAFTRQSDGNSGPGLTYSPGYTNEIGPLESVPPEGWDFEKNPVTPPPPPPAKREKKKISAKAVSIKPTPIGGVVKSVDHNRWIGGEDSSSRDARGATEWGDMNEEAGDF